MPRVTANGLARLGNIDPDPPAVANFLRHSGDLGRRWASFAGHSTWTGTVDQALSQKRSRRVARHVQLRAHQRPAARTGDDAACRQLQSRPAGRMST